MLKELLSDLIKITNPTYQPDSFNPYISMILTIITITILAYGLQTTANTIHTYAVRPASFADKNQPSGKCSNFTKNSLTYICSGLLTSNITQNISYSSFEQDLHKSIK